MIMIAKTVEKSAALQHVLWAAIEKVGHQELNAKQLETDSQHEVQINLQGRIDDQTYNYSIQSVLNVGTQQEKSSSANPQIGKLVAWILSKLNSATRERILADIPAEFAETGAIPAADEAVIAATKEMLKQLRTQKTVVARGPIRCQYVLQESVADDAPIQLPDCRDNDLNRDCRCTTATAQR